MISIASCNLLHWWNIIIAVIKEKFIYWGFSEEGIWGFSKLCINKTLTNLLSFQYCNSFSIFICKTPSKLCFPHLWNGIMKLVKNNKKNLSTFLGSENKSMDFQNSFFLIVYLKLFKMQCLLVVIFTFIAWKFFACLRKHPPRLKYDYLMRKWK